MNNLTPEAIRLYVDIAYRIPRKQILLCGSDYKLWNGSTEKITVSNSYILELETSGFLSKYPTNGYYVTSLGYDSVDQYIQKKSRTNSHNKTEYYYDLGEPYESGADS
jgi:hypothetical protein